MTRDGMQAIVTRYLGPTNHRGARIKATCNACSVTISYPHELNPPEAHRAAAEALMLKMGWHATLYCGGLPNGGYAFVQVTDR